MNKSTGLRSEEARRQAQAAMQKAKQQQSELLKERAMMFASETKKIENLRAQRLAKLESDKVAGEQAEAAVAPAPAAKKRPARALPQAKAALLESRA